MTSPDFLGFGRDEPEIELLRRGPKRFALGQYIRYQDPQFGTITMPDRLDDFETDLASLPWVSAWYVPEFGPQLVPSILHDALVGDAERQTYRTRDNLSISQRDAHRVYLDAMRATGTPLIRRNIMWSAVSLTGAGRGGRLRLILWYSLVAVLGIYLTLETLDVLDLIPFIPSLIGDYSFPIEWGISVVVMTVSATILGPLIYGPRGLKFTAIQAIVYGITFLPTVLMIIPRLLLVEIPERLLSTR